MAEVTSLTDDARARGREQALVARRARAAIKADLAAARLTAADVLAASEADPAIARLRVRDLLLALPGIGLARADDIMARCDIAPARRLSGLGVHQVTSLLAAVGDSRSLRGRMLVLSGPSGVGKSSVVSALRQQHPQVAFSVSVTTRLPRPGEVDGEHYHFIDAGEFDRMIAHDELLEWAEFAGNRYGTPAASVEAMRRTGRPVLLEIELQGARQVRRTAPDAVQVFLAPPSWETLVARLEGRRTEAPEVIEQRLATARIELAAEPEFDRTVVNDELDRTVAEVATLLGVVPAGPSGRLAP